MTIPPPNIRAFYYWSLRTSCDKTHVIWHISSGVPREKPCTFLASKYEHLKQ